MKPTAGGSGGAATTTKTKARNAAAEAAAAATPRRLPFGHLAVLAASSRRPLSSTAGTSAVAGVHGVLPDTRAFLTALRADIRDLLDAAACAWDEERHHLAISYASFLHEWQARGWARVGLVLGENRLARARAVSLIQRLFVEHWTPLHQYLKTGREQHGDSEDQVIQQAAQAIKQDSYLRSLLLRAVAALYALYTLQAAYIPPDPADGEDSNDAKVSSFPRRAPRGCLALTPVPTWSELVLLPVLNARVEEKRAFQEEPARRGKRARATSSKTAGKRKREAGEDDAAESAVASPKDNKGKGKAVTRETQHSSSDPAPPTTVDAPNPAEDADGNDEQSSSHQARTGPRKKYRPRPSRAAVESTAHALALRTQRELERATGTILVHPDEGRIWVPKCVWEEVVLLLPRLVGACFASEPQPEAEEAGRPRRRDDEVWAEDEVCFVVRALCGCADGGDEQGGQDDDGLRTGFFRLLADGVTDDVAMMDTSTDTPEARARDALGPLWTSATRWRATETMPAEVGGYLALRITPTSTGSSRSNIAQADEREIYIALSRADALRLAVAERTGALDLELDPGTASPPSGTSDHLVAHLVRERARADLFRSSPSFALDEEARAEEQGLSQLARGMFEVDGRRRPPVLWVDRALVLGAEEGAAALLGSGVLQGVQRRAAPETEVGTYASQPTTNGADAQGGSAFSDEAVAMAAGYTMHAQLAPEPSRRGHPADEAPDGDVVNQDDDEAPFKQDVEKGRFVRVPPSCLSEARVYVDAVLGARVKGMLSVSDAMMGVEGTAFGEEEDEVEIALVGEHAARLVGGGPPSGSDQDSTMASMDGDASALAAALTGSTSTTPFGGIALPGRGHASPMTLMNAPAAAASASAAAAPPARKRGRPSKDTAVPWAAAAPSRSTSSTSGNGVPAPSSTPNPTVPTPPPPPPPARRRRAPPQEAREVPTVRVPMVELVSELDQALVEARRRMVRALAVGMGV